MNAPGCPSLPILRLGQPYESLDLALLQDPRSGRPVAQLSLANPGLIRRDLRSAGAAARRLARLPCRELFAICRRAADLFLNAPLPLGPRDPLQTPEAYLADLSACSGLPHPLCRANLQKIHAGLSQLERILAGLTRGLDPRVLDAEADPPPDPNLCFFPGTESLGVVLPSNSPGVNTLWLPALALKIPLFLKPGREEPWTPYRILQALLAAGYPREALGFYPSTHEGAEAILQGCGRALLFGDEKTTARHASNPRIQRHGPGRSKILIGEDQIDDWESHLDLLVESIASNGGRSCVNASAVLVPRHARRIAQALGERLGPLQPAAPEDPQARLAAFPQPGVARWIEQRIEEGLAVPGAEDCAAAHRNGPRLACCEYGTFLRPTIVWCESMDHPLANREFLFPYASVVEVPQERMLEQAGPSLVVSALTADRAWRAELLRSPLIDRLNLGPIPTTRIGWDQPHEGNLFEFLYQRRAIQRTAG